MLFRSGPRLFQEVVQFVLLVGGGINPSLFEMCVYLAKVVITDMSTQTTVHTCGHSLCDFITHKVSVSFSVTHFLTLFSCPMQR